jgi:hypothetical protein
MGYLEDRIKTFITGKLREKGYDPASFFPADGYAVFPGSSSTAAELIHEAKFKIRP